MKKSISGVTLIELMVGISIISISVVGILMAINTAGILSADPLAQMQSVSIAESYLEEILSKDFPVTPCPIATNRSDFTNICQYDGLSEKPTDQAGTAVAGLENYTVIVQVNKTTVSLGSPELSPGTQVVRIDVKVSHPRTPMMTFSVYKTSY